MSVSIIAITGVLVGEVKKELKSYPSNGSVVVKKHIACSRLGMVDMPAYPYQGTPWLLADDDAIFLNSYFTRLYH